MDKLHPEMDRTSPNITRVWFVLISTGCIKKMSHLVCLISRQPSIWFSNSFFLMKNQIHTQILNTKPSLCLFGGLSYLLNEVGFLIRWFWLKPKLIDLELPHILKTIKIKTIITFIQSVWVTRPARSHFGAIRTVLVQLVKFDANFSVLRSV